MRLQSIQLPAYGPFAGESLDLSRGKGKLEVIYGWNEAGKSSLLRAISDFLFGIPAQTRDAFLHPYPSLRIRATIESGGETLECVRRKANKDSVRTADDVEPVPDELFRRFVPIESREVFQKMFGLDAERLRQGGEELVQGQGEVGGLLFSAAAGIRGLHAVLSRFDSEAQALFKPRASTTAVARLLDALKTGKDRLRQAQVSVTEWNRLVEQRDGAAAEIERIEARMLDRQREAEKLRRIRQSLPLLRRRAELVEQLMGLGAVKVLREGFAEDYRRAAFERETRLREVERSAQRGEELEKAAAAIAVPEGLLAREQEILELYKEAGAERKAAADRGRLAGEVLRAEAGMRDLLLSLGEPPDLDRVPGLAVPAASRRLVQDLAARRASLETEISGSRESLAAETARLEQSHRLIEALPAPIPLAGLQAAAQEALVAAQAGARARDLEAASARDRRGILEELKALPWPSTLDALASAALPPAELVIEWTARLDRAEQTAEQAGQQLRASQAETARRAAQLETLRAGRSLPSLERLSQDRERRELGWTAVRRAWLEGDSASPEARQFLGRPADERALAGAYEASVAEADRTADRLREAADQVAQLEQARVALEAARQEAAARQAELELAQEKQAGQRSAWEALWRPFGLAAGAPRQMAEWLRRRDALLSRSRAVEQRAEEAAALLRQTDRARQRLLEELAAAGETLPPGTDSLDAALARSRQVLEREERRRREREKLAAQIETSERALAAAGARLTQAASALEEWSRKWGELMAGLGLPAATEPAAAQEVIRVRDELQTLARTVRDLRIRIAGMERDAASHRQRLTRLLEAVAPDLVPTPSQEAVSALHQRLAAARQAGELREARRGDLAREAKALEEAQRQLSLAEGRLAALATEAGCEEPRGLPERIEQSDARRALEKRLADAEEHLAVIGAGLSIGELEAEAAAVDPDQIPGLAEAIDRERESSQQQLKKAEGARVTAGNELRRMEESADTCAAAAEVEAARAGLLETAEEYVRLRLAQVVLKGAIEQYRAKAQSELLARSGELFALLTASSFGGLKLDWDESGGAVLVGVRGAGGERVPLEGMSDGARDQLYLAIRLAHIELYARGHEPIPFIADDILVNFDDRRAAAAIGALAGLAAHTQVLLFTHHAHLVELARETLPAGKLAVSEITCGAVRSASGGAATAEA